MIEIRVKNISLETANKFKDHLDYFFNTDFRINVEKYCIYFIGD